jgi:site-specific recombinase XerD
MMVGITVAVHVREFLEFFAQERNLSQNVIQSNERGVGNLRASIKSI